jgi:hypothetical protein
MDTVSQFYFSQDSKRGQPLEGASMSGMGTAPTSVLSSQVFPGIQELH